MKKHSLKIKLTLIMAAVVATVMIIVCVLNSTLSEKYYIKDRKNILISSYNKMENTLLSDSCTSSTIKETMSNINASHNINVFVLDSNWKTLYSTQYGAEETYRWLQNFMFSMDSDIEVIEDNNRYTIKKGYDTFSNRSFLVIYGTIEDGYQVVMQITIESIKENVKIFNRFIQLVGIAVLVISIVLVYIISSRFTKPMKEISKIAEEVSHMNFGVKYEGKDKSEVGTLGKSINAMANSLKVYISELKEANVKLQKDNDLKTKNDEMRREFLSNVSHELKTPIALIQGYAEGLKEGITDDPKSTEFYCDVIIDEASKMNEMVKKLLTLNQIEFGKDHINVERFDLCEMISSIIKSNVLIFKQKEINCNFEAVEPVYVWYDQIQIEEVFTNYISNAINHCDGARKIEVKAVREDKQVRVSVYNTGQNIPEEDIDRIWEKFYKVDKARTREYGGNGIGLSIVKAVLDTYKAPYGVNNVPDGVEFWFILDCE